MKPLHRLLAAVLTVLALAFGGRTVTAVEPQKPALLPQHMTVVLDDNYPPYVFRDEAGDLQGILKDSWDLWSRKTGIVVDIRAMDWSQAQKEMAEGRADAIDTIFWTKERSQALDFSKPYADLEVPIYFDQSLSGITGAESLKGFTIGVKDGDASIDWLRERGINDFHTYPSYEKLVEAAVAKEVLVFCMDAPPATYLLLKHKALNRFRRTEPLYTGQFRWAVHKGDQKSFELLSQGFAKISDAERREIERHWFGSKLSLLANDDTVRQFGQYLAVTLLALALLAAWVWSLRRQVAVRTRKLSAALDALSQSEERFRQAMDASADGLWDWDIRTDRTYFSPSYFIMLGYAPDELPMNGGTWLNLMHPDDREQAMAANLDCIDNRCERFSTEFRMKTKDGGWKWILGRGRALQRAPNGRALRMIGTHADITARKTLELSLTRSNREMEQFAYVASHDLREPLRMVSSYVELLSRRYSNRLDAEGLEFIAFAREGAKRMDRLILDLLEYSRIGRTAKHPPHAVDLTEAAEQAIAILGPAIEETKASVVINTLPTVTGLRDDLVRLFQNLIGNAVKYHHPERPPKITLDGERQDSGWLIRVKDNGIGIHPDYLERIFGIFQRLHARDEYEGTGIGLANCKKIVEHHGGRIWAESTPGQGSCFCVFLPDR